ncbi:MAG: acyl carrier protein [Fimbriimonadaceae bacterium]|nr:acyl carrier protein [Fimbriimonadaceae bacterium]
MSQDVLERVIKVTCAQLNKQPSEVTAASAFMEDLGADSLDVVEIVMALEDEFGVEIPDTDVTNIKTVGDAADYVSKKSE